MMKDDGALLALGVVASVASAAAFVGRDRGSRALSIEQILAMGEKIKSSSPAPSPKAKSKSSRFTSRMTEFTRTGVREVQSDSLDALQGVARKHGLLVRHDGGSFSPESYRLKVEFNTKAGKSGRSGEPANYRSQARQIGIPEDSFGATFVTGRRGTRYKIVALKLSRWKYPITGEGPRGGRYKFTVDQVLRGLRSKRGSRSMALFHGAHSRLTIGHEGQCFVDKYGVAALYGSTVCGVSLDLDQLVLEDCDGYDPHENEAPADRVEFRSEAAGRGVDVLVYDDVDESGQEHTCYRLISARAVKMARETGVQIFDEDDARDFWIST